jgi:hypothetical protein
MTCTRNLLALLPALLLFSGCATMNRAECLTVDWKTVGYEDGAAGRPGERVAQHRKACAKHGVTPDLQAYQVGREQGLRVYCQPQNGYRVGERGGDNPGFCPADLANDFEAAFRDGSELHHLRSRVSQAQNDLSAMYAELQRGDDAMAIASAVVIDDNADKATKAQALRDVKRLAERRAVLRSQIRQLEEDLPRFQRDVDQFLASPRPH